MRRPYVLLSAAMSIDGYLDDSTDTRLMLSNNHLQYAITWYALAAVLAVIYFLYHRRAVPPEVRR